MGCRGKRGSERPTLPKEVSPRMERMRGEVRAVALMADQWRYLPECDAIAALRRSFIGALAKNNNAEKGVPDQRMTAPPSPRAVRQPRLTH
jgi:hypothetical protein